MHNQTVINTKGVPEPQSALNKIKIIENNDPLVDLRVACPDITLVPNLLPYARQTVAKMLNKAQKRLPQGYFILVHDAYRTLDTQKALWDEYYAWLKRTKPDWPVQTLYRVTNKYVAPYNQIAPPGHCTGGALDVTIVDGSGKEIDMESPLDSHAAQATFVDGLSAEAKANRMMLVEAMLGAGFSNCRDEYWHYSYGDSAWAVRTGQAECVYGIAELPADCDCTCSSKIRVFCYPDSIEEVTQQQ